MSWDNINREFELIDGQVYLKISDDDRDRLISDLEDELKAVDRNLRNAMTCIQELTAEKVAFEKQLNQLREYKKSI